MVQIKYTAAALIVAAAVAAPTFAYSLNDESSISAREVNDLVEFLARDAAELEERELAADVDNLIARASAHLAERGYDGDDELLTREFDELFQRDLADLVERDPLFRWVGRLKNKIMGKKNQDQSDPVDERDYFDEEMNMEARDFDEDIYERDLAELVERDPLFRWVGRLKNKITGKKNQDQSDLDERDYFDEEMNVEARDFEEASVYERDMADLVERSRWLRKPKEQLDERDYFDEQMSVEARDYDEFDLEARDPFLRKLRGWVAKKIAPKQKDQWHQDNDYQQSYEGREYDDLLERHYDELMERELAAQPEVVERDLSSDFTEILERDVDTEELVAREPGVVEWFKNLFGGNKKKKEAEKKKAEEKKAAAAAASTESEPEARGFYDEFDELD